LFQQFVVGVSYDGADYCGTSRLMTSINAAILTRPTAIPWPLFLTLLLAWVLVSDRRSIADENESAAASETIELGIATLSKFLLGPGKLAAVEVQPSGDGDTRLWAFFPDILDHARGGIGRRSGFSGNLAR
jgi:hypothetical protein